MSFPNHTTKIDVHHHVYPPVYTAAIQNAGGDPSGWFIPKWTLEADFELCQQMGIATTILSATAPGPDIEAEPEKAQKLARAINEFNAGIVKTHPQNYGFFASVPDLLNTEAAIEEMKYALDELKADGVVLLTRYGNDNHYLGHPDFAPIWDFLSARKAVVFIHPTHPVDTNLVNKHLPQPAYDYPHETGRTAIDMITTGMLRNHAKDCKIILSHAGGDLPFLIDRTAGLLQFAPASFSPNKGREEMVEEARWFWYDTALSSSTMNLKGLMALLGEDGKDHVLFGSDYPNASKETVELFTKQLEELEEWDVEGLAENGKKLFPRLA